MSNGTGAAFVALSYISLRRVGEPELYPMVCISAAKKSCGPGSRRAVSLRDAYSQHRKNSWIARYTNLKLG